MRYLLLVSIWLAAGCRSAYEGVRIASARPCIEAFQPEFSRVVYSAQAEVAGRHLTGLLMIKAMPDSSIRMVFTNEAGFKFFDFGFSGDNFTVYYITEQMNRKAVLKTLRKDFELILMQHTRQPFAVIRKKDEWYYDFKNGKDHYYYITDSACSSLLRMERGSSRKKVVEAYLGNFTNHMPDTIAIRHVNFNFTITLQQLDDDAAE